MTTIKRIPKQHFRVVNQTVDEEKAMELEEEER